MIIKSQFKDYYDYVEHINGGDPKVVYIRHRLKPLQDVGNFHIPPTIKLQFQLNRALPNSYIKDLRNYKFKWCVVAGKYYLLVEENIPNEGTKPWTLVTPDSEVMNKLCVEKKHRLLTQPECTSARFFGTGDPTVIALCKQLNQPVFTVSNRYGYMNDQDKFFHRKRIPLVEIDCELPILKDLGFASVIPAEIMYQDIAYFMSNTIRTNPDIAPPVEISNKDKITGHGFDLQESFRHRRD